MADWAALAEQTLARCRELARYSEEPAALTRTFLSPPMADVHAVVRAWMEAAGMQVRCDPAGNLIGRLPAAAANAPTLLLGSHLDTVRNAGAFDGALGVVAGIAVVEAVVEAVAEAVARTPAQTPAAPLPFALEVVGFSEEEGVRFGRPYLGSLALTGQFPPELLALTDADGVSVADALRAFGLEPGRLPEAAIDPDTVLGYLELHIEQGPVLEQLDAPVGVVTAIAGQSRREFTFVGRAGHAGTTPMALRRDALAGAAAFVSRVEAYAQATPELVATVGRLRVRPNVGNVIAGEATASLDVRHRDDAVRSSAIAALEEAAHELAGERRLTLSVRALGDEASCAMDEGFVARLQQLTGAPTLVSGAGHDAVILSRFTRTAMLFVRSPGGISHHPDETVRADDVAAALEAMTRFVLALAAEHRQEVGHEQA